MWVKHKKQLVNLENVVSIDVFVNNINFAIGSFVANFRYKTEDECNNAYVKLYDGIVTKKEFVEI